MTHTLSDTRTADHDLLETLRQCTVYVGHTYPDDDCVHHPYILAVREVRNCSGRVCGTEYDVSDEVYADLVEALEADRAAGLL
jgi:hypothetical protein